MNFTGLTFDEERALYGVHHARISHCTFDGPADGESALKESSNIEVTDCDFRLRYPFWHTNTADIERITMTDTCRAALWYCRNIRIADSSLNGIKAVRECEDVAIEDSAIESSEFGWMSRRITMKNTSLVSEYPFLKSSDIELDGFELSGKYSFQYVEDVKITNSRLDTKDAFWHSRNVTVTDSVVKGEYLGWYSHNLRLVRCKIIGTQPLCYCTGLVLEDCEMVDCDLSFENSEVKASVRGEITSVKNPYRGWIRADSIGEIIEDEQKKPDGICEITVTDRKIKCQAAVEKADILTQGDKHVGQNISKE